MMMNNFFAARPSSLKYPYLVGVWLVFLLSSVVANAQQRTVTGFVKDSLSKKALANVSILLKDSSIGTKSDQFGRFSIDVPEDAVLIFSSLGYSTQESVVSSNVLNVNLEPQGFELADIVVVGTRMRKSDLTGAIGTISAEQLKEVPTTDLTTAMQGKVPGLYISRSNAAPGEDITIKVRGTNSISYGTNPVYVIDGIIAEEGLRMVNPDDIASIEVLKDASSTALYGSKASNGVVVITTKRGQSGARFKTH